MKLGVLGRAIAITVLLLANTSGMAEWDTRGNVSVQLQTFPNDSIHEADQQTNLSIAGEVELYRDVGENGSLTITPFARLDENDEERTHFDFREFIYTHLGDDWEARIGLGKVFWGVAESSNLVDVINQLDTVENDDSSAKLGQPMLNLLLTRDWGDIDLYILPGLREQTFPGVDGRPRPPVIIDADNALFESNNDEKHVDVAARISGAVDQWDLGFHVFQGTARSPLFRFNPLSNSVVPFYYQHTQVGFDIQATLESWLLKTELIYQSADEIEDHAALVTGFEYSFYDIRESGADLGIVTEWLYDEREELAGQPFQNDALIGLRLALNDEQSLEGLVGVIADLDGGGQLLTLEGSRRFGSNIKASVLMTLFQNVDEDAFFSGFDDEDNLQLDIAYFF
ncbi:MAG: hypothetical protein AB8B79_12600 [Granulosicoccus sp.]